MEHGQNTLNKEQSQRLFSWGIRFFLASALTAGQSPGNYAPFALGYLAAVGPGAEGTAALAGTFTGALLFLDFEDALPHMAAAVLILAAAIAFRGIRTLTQPGVVTATASGMVLGISSIYAV